jgi:hypothetical protein
MIDVVVRNGPELTAALHRLGRDMDDLADGNRDAAQLVAARSRRRAPRRTGRLANSIRPAAEKGRAVITSSVRYGMPVHQGVPSHNMPPNPFITDTAEATQDEWLPMYRRDLQQTIDRDVGSVG